MSDGYLVIRVDDASSTKFYLKISGLSSYYYIIRERIVSGVTRFDYYYSKSPVNLESDWTNRASLNYEETMVRIEQVTDIRS